MTPRYITIDLKRVVEGAFTPEELKALAAQAPDDCVMDAVDMWTDPLMDSLELNHRFEGLVNEYIKENYKGAI